MANYYYDATGVLYLKRVTPVIRALFGAFHLDENHPGNGQAYIARISGSNNPRWDDVREGLAGLAAELGLALPDQDGEDPSIESFLFAFAEHFGTDHDEELGNLIERHSFEDAADLDALFLIATRFDDGHGLTAIEFEGCRYCNKPRLFEFGGEACFLSREVSLDIDTRLFLTLGKRLRQAVREDDVDQASARVLRVIAIAIGHIRDEGFRCRVWQSLAERLAPLCD